MCSQPSNFMFSHNSCQVRTASSTTQVTATVSTCGVRYTKSAQTKPRVDRRGAGKLLRGSFEELIMPRRLTSTRAAEAGHEGSTFDCIPTEREGSTAHKRCLLSKSKVQSNANTVQHTDDKCLTLTDTYRVLLAAKGTAPLDATKYDTVNAAKGTSPQVRTLAELKFAPGGPTTAVPQNVADCLTFSETLTKPNTKDGVQLLLPPFAILRTLAQKPPM